MRKSDALDANELLAFAVDPSIRPGAAERYKLLLRRYQTDPEFCELFGALAGRLGLRVLAADDLLGLILDATESSPFAPTLDGLRASLSMPSSSDDRVIYGLIVAGIAAWCYPDPESFATPGVRYVRATQIDRKLRELCERLAKQHERGEPDEGDELQYAWDAYAIRKSHKLGRGGGLTHDCTLWMVGRTLRWLVDQDFLIKDSKDAELFRATDRFRHHVRAAASRKGYQVIAAAIRATEAPIDIARAADPNDDTLAESADGETD